MSKSLGNSMSPKEICDKWGADLLRVWVASQDFTEDVRLSDAIMVQLAEAYRKIRNTFRFALSNLFDFDPARDAVADADLWEIDAWMLRRTGTLVRECREWFDKFEFHRVYHRLHDFCAVDLSAFYFDILKDRLYTFAPRSRGRRSAQSAVYRIASALVRLITPTLVYTAEEVWKHMPHLPGDPSSVHMTVFPAAEELERALDEPRSKIWKKLEGVRDEVLKKLEAARSSKLISSALEAKVTINAPEPSKLLRKYEPILPSLFIVSQVRVDLGPRDPLATSDEDDLGSYTIRVDKADGKKCERCWNYSTHVGESADYPTLCERCLAALSEIERDAAGDIPARSAIS
jgi:isoleucyl-tRNA synthetase